MKNFVRFIIQAVQLVRFCKAYGSGDGNAQDCVFPFKHNGKTYQSCATSIDGNGPYCATKVDSNGNMVKDKWARCNKYCNTDRGDMIFIYFESDRK